MKRLFFMFLYFSFIGLGANYAQVPDSCLKLLKHQKMGFQNPDSVKVDSCYWSPTFGQLYAKQIFRVEFQYNVIPRSGIYPKDTIIEYTWHDILTTYLNTKNEFQHFESLYGTFWFREYLPQEPDTTKFLPRVLLLRLMNYSNIDSVENKIGHVSLVTNFNYLRRYEDTNLDVPSKNPENKEDFEVSPNPTTDFIEISVGANGRSPLQSDVSIYNVLGEIQATPNPTPTLPASREGVRIDISSLPPGMYFVRIGDKVGKFIKL
jgi:hypothetical protein